MKLHTTPDGQITYEGLPVVNQEEVKWWIWAASIVTRITLRNALYNAFLLKPNTDYELPDEEFDKMTSSTDNEVYIFRKPVSEEGEKKNEEVVFFVEHKETHLWWYPEQDKSRPNYITTFRGDRFRGIGYETKDCWTNNPYDKRIAYKTRTEAQKMIDQVIIVDYDKHEVTEHLFVNPEAQTVHKGEKNKGLGGSSDLWDEAIEIYRVYRDNEGITKAMIELKNRYSLTRKP